MQPSEWISRHERTDSVTEQPRAIRGHRVPRVRTNTAACPATCQMLSQHNYVRTGCKRTWDTNTPGGGHEYRLQEQAVAVPRLVPPRTSSPASGKLRDLSVPQCPHLWSGNDSNTPLTRRCWGFRELIYIHYIWRTMSGKEFTLYVCHY